MLRLEQLEIAQQQLHAVTACHKIASFVRRLALRSAAKAVLRMSHGAQYHRQAQIVTKLTNKLLERSLHHLDAIIHDRNVRRSEQQLLNNWRMGLQSCIVMHRGRRDNRQTMCRSKRETSCTWMIKWARRLQITSMKAVLTNWRTNFSTKLSVSMMLSRAIIDTVRQSVRGHHVLVCVLYWFSNTVAAMRSELKLLQIRSEQVSNEMQILQHERVQSCNARNLLSILCMSRAQTQAQRLRSAVTQWLNRLVTARHRTESVLHCKQLADMTTVSDQRRAIRQLLNVTLRRSSTKMHLSLQSWYNHTMTCKHQQATSVQASHKRQAHLHVALLLVASQSMVYELKSVCSLLSLWRAHVAADSLGIYEWKVHYAAARRMAAIVGRQIERVISHCVQQWEASVRAAQQSESLQCLEREKSQGRCAALLCIARQRWRASLQLQLRVHRWQMNQQSSRNEIHVKARLLLQLCMPLVLRARLEICLRKCLDTFAENKRMWFSKRQLVVITSRVVILQQRHALKMLRQILWHAPTAQLCVARWAGTSRFGTAVTEGSAVHQKLQEQLWASNTACSRAQAELKERVSELELANRGQDRLEARLQEKSEEFEKLMEFNENGQQVLQELNTAQSKKAMLAIRMLFGVLQRHVDHQNRLLLVSWRHNMQLAEAGANLDNKEMELSLTRAELQSLTESASGDAKEAAERSTRLRKRSSRLRCFVGILVTCAHKSTTQFLVYGLVMQWVGGARQEQLVAARTANEVAAKFRKKYKKAVKQAEEEKTQAASQMAKQKRENLATLMALTDQLDAKQAELDAIETTR